MRRLLVVLVLVIAGLTTASVAGAATSGTLVAVLGPVGDCGAGRGVAIVTVTEEGTLEYRLVVANLENVTAAHIHRSTGDVSTVGAVAFLYEAPSPVDVHDTVVLASGTIAATVEEGLSVEDPAAELLGGTSFYVNVHTTGCPSGALAGDLLLQGV